MLFLVKNGFLWLILLLYDQFIVQITIIFSINNQVKLTCTIYSIFQQNQILIKNKDLITFVSGLY